MNIFLSYPSSHRHAVESVCYELQAEGHEVFFDKEDLPPGQGYNERIRHAIENCDLFIFMITPESVCKGKYTLTELKIAIRKWPNPAGHVLPVMLESTHFDAIPAYLKAVTVLSPEGNLTAEVAMEVADLLPDPLVDQNKVEHIIDLPKLSYLPVEIRFGVGNAGEYPVSITDSPAGHIAAKPHPFNPKTVEGILQKQTNAQNQTLRLTQTHQTETGNALLPNMENAKQIGEQLYQLLFNSSIQNCLDISLKSISPQKGKGLRFLINTTEAPDLARLPWEFLYSPRHDDFLFTDMLKPVVRWLDVEQPPPSLTVKPPLRLLIAIASPVNRPELSVGKEISRLDEALRELVDKGLVHIHRLEHTTLEQLDKVLLQYKPHVLHFIGHGDFSENEGKVILEANTPEGAMSISGNRLSVLLRNHLGSLRFVFLNSCLGAKTSLKDPFSGVAQSLIQRGIPAAIAMQFPIPDPAAVSLARHFYRYLAAGLPVDAAITSTRALLFARGFDVEWAAPALYMRTPDGRLFDVDSIAENQAPLIKPSFEELEKKEPSQTDNKKSNVNKWWLLLLLLFLTITIAATIFSLFYFDRHQDDIDPAPLIQISDQEKIVEKAYHDALAALKLGETQTAIDYLKLAKQNDPNLNLLAQYSKLRSELISAFADQVTVELSNNNYDLSQKIVDQIRKIDPSVFQKLQTNLINTLNTQIKLALDLGEWSIAQELVNKLSKIDPDHTKIHELQQKIDNQIILPTGENPISETEYMIEQGNSLWTIAKAVYGDANLWMLIYKANQDKIKNPDLIYQGQKLILPAYNEAHTSSLPQSIHHVKKGDSLWQISTQAYGDAIRWPEIYAANRKNIKNPDYIFPKQELIIPNYKTDKSN